MSLRQTLLKRLPPFRYQQDVISRQQSTRDLVKEVLKAHQVFAPQYDLILEYFPGDPYQVSEALFNFCQSLPYKEEAKEHQTSRSPAAALTMPFTVGTCDCKHYAGFIAGILDSYSRNVEEVEWYYRFCGYQDGSKQYTHVYVVVVIDGEEIWIDPAPIGKINRDFNDRYAVPKSYTDKTVSMLSRMSGFSSADTVNDTVLPGELVETGLPVNEQEVEVLEYQVLDPDTGVMVTATDVETTGYAVTDPLTAGGFVKEIILKNPLTAAVVTGLLVFIGWDLLKPKHSRGRR